MVRDDRTGTEYRDHDVAGNEVVNGLSSTAIWNVIKFYLCNLRKPLAQEVLIRADAGRRIDIRQSVDIHAGCGRPHTDTGCGTGRCDLHIARHRIDRRDLRSAGVRDLSPQRFDAGRSG